MKAPPDLILASAAACMRMLEAKDFHEKDAARREYAHIERQISSITKISQPTGHVPLGMSPQDLLR